MTKSLTTKQIATQLQNEIVVYKNNIEENYYKLARACRVFMDNQYYLDLGYKDVQDWVKDTLRFGKRKLDYLISIEKKFDACGVSEDDRKQIEWCKAREVVKILTPENKDKWIENAKTMPVRQLEIEIASEKAMKNIQDHRPIGYIYIPYFDDEQKKTMFNGLELAAKMTASDRREVQFMAMCQECDSSWTPYADMIEDPVRREILERDNYTCRVPDCGKRDNIEIHEVVFRSRGGKVEPNNSICLCSTHHKEVTDEHLTIETLGDNVYRFIKKGQ